MELPAPPKALSGDVVQPEDERILEQDFVVHPLVSDPIIDAEFVEGAAAEDVAGFEEPFGADDASADAPTQSADPIIDLSESLEVAE